MRIITLGCLALFTMFPNLNNRLASRPPSNTWLAANSNAVGKVVNIIGTASISRKNVRRPIPVRRNIQLIQGDKLTVANSSTVKVICFADFQHVNLQTGPHSDICQASQSGDVFTDTLNQGRPEIIKRPNGEVILKPRANNYPEFLAKIVDARPMYLGSSISFRKLLPNDKRSDLVKLIRALPSIISDDEKRLLLVDVYSMNENYDHAIEELNAVSNAVDDPLIQLNLGDLYVALSQSGAAKRAYSSAIKGAKNLDDPMAEALAQHAFGLLLGYERARLEDASTALMRAIELYRDLGENQAANILQTELNNFRSKPPKPSRRRSRR